MSLKSRKYCIKRKNTLKQQEKPKKKRATKKTLLNYANSVKILSSMDSYLNCTHD